MWCLINSVAMLVVCSLLTAQAPSPGCAQDASLEAGLLEMSPAAYEPFVFAAAVPLNHAPRLKGMVKKEINQAMMSENRPAVDAWRPLTMQEKFQTFARSIYASGTYAGASLDAVTEKFLFPDRAYQPGWPGLGQYYGVMLANSESDLFLKRFLLPTVLKQDPRYFRNPSLSLARRFFYSTSRVFVARADSGGQMFNGSMVLGSAARQALKDFYVPGERQGIGAIGSRMAFDLLREAGDDLLHEFWPDVRRRFLHR
jgi:hypothetical protein